MLEIEQTGALALIQDLGRPGLAHLGVPVSGAADRNALRLGNRLVGNPEGSAAIECVLGGLRVTAHALHWVAVTGAPTEVLVNGTRMSSHSSIPLRAGDTLLVVAPRHGLRSYLAVRGGILAAATLGSRSTDVLTRLGPAPLTDGEQLLIGPPERDLPAADLVPAARPGTVLEILPGPRRDWFDDHAWPTLVGTTWQVSSSSNRVAIRLTGPELARSHPGELPSEAMARGAVQVPTSGQPLVFGPDHPVTGGYPVIAVLTELANDAAAQLRPGDGVRFAPARR